MIYVLLCRKFSKKSRPQFNDDSCESDKKLTKMIVLVALPVTLTAAALYFSQFLDTVIIVNCLKNAGMPEKTAQTLYSAYTGLSVPIYDLLPATLVFPIATSILPAVSGALAVSKNKRAQGLTAQAIRISGIIAVPCGVFLMITGRSCISLLYGANKWSASLPMADGSTIVALDAASNALIILGFAVFFISVVSTCNSLLNAYGKSHLPFFAVLCGIVVLTVCEVALLNSPMGIQGAPASSLVCYCVVMVLDIFFLRKYCGVRLKMMGLFARPVACGAISAAVTYGAYKGASAIWLNYMGNSIDTRMGAFFVLMISGIALVVSYASSVLALKAIKEDEIRLLPKGNAIANKLVKMGWIKQQSDIEE
jgi:stage V sporulation protein B